MKKTCEHLLPGFNLSKNWMSGGITHGFNCKYSLEESLSKLMNVKAEIAKEDSYLLASHGHGGGMKDEKLSTKLLPQQKAIINEEIDKLESRVRKDNGFNPLASWSMPLKDFDEMTEEEQEEEYIRQAEEDYAIYVYPYEYHFFAIGIKRENDILWFICYTNRNSGKYDTTRFNIGICDLYIKNLISYPLLVKMPQKIEKKIFFGRGCFSDTFIKKKIAVVGLGAVGSMVAESLARSGVTVISLWDNDIVEPGNICRSSYLLNDIGESKVDAIAKRIRSINPFVRTKEINAHGYWYEHSVNYYTYEGGSFYSNINYNNQEQSLEQLKGFDIIIDCTGSNEMLHFLSYAVPGTTIISLCITNHSNDLLCITNKYGNPFELRKAYLSRIEQDTKNFYMEGSGCYAPTFLARNCDISSLVNLAVRELNTAIEEDKIPDSMIFSHDRRGVLIDRIKSYKADGYDISLSVPSEAVFDAEEMGDDENGELGYILGSYSRDGKMIMITHFIDAVNAKDILCDAFNTSMGIIDYIGDYTYSGEQANTYREETLAVIEAKAEDKTINTNNPLLAIRNPDGTISFFLYINNRMVPFVKQD